MSTDIENGIFEESENHIINKAARWDLRAEYQSYEKNNRKNKCPLGKSANQWLEIDFQHGRHDSSFGAGCLKRRLGTNDRKQIYYFQQIYHRLQKNQGGVPHYRAGITNMMNNSNRFMNENTKRASVSFLIL